MQGVMEDQGLHFYYMLMGRKAELTLNSNTAPCLLYLWVACKMTLLQYLSHIYQSIYPSMLCLCICCMFLCLCCIRRWQVIWEGWVTILICGQEMGHLSKIWQFWYLSKHLKEVSAWTMWIYWEKLYRYLKGRMLRATQQWYNGLHEWRRHWWQLKFIKMGKVRPQRNL